MNPIIDPSWFYWMSVLDSLKTVAFITIIVIIIAFVLSIGVFVDDYSYDDEDSISERNRIKQFYTISAVIFILCVLVAVFVPSKQTMYEMMVAKLATYENVEMTVDGLKQVVDYAVESIERIK